MALSSRPNPTPSLDIESPLEMALAYAARAWWVFPCHTVIDGRCDCRKACKHPGKHPRTMHGLVDATTDSARILHWWGMWPLANIAIATGPQSGLVIVDIDPRNGGFETWDELLAADKCFPPSPVVRTQSGGKHLYFAHPGGRVKSGANIVGKGIDIKADGGYVIAPPSVGMSGRYEWQRASELGVLA